MNELNMNTEIGSLADLFLLDPLDENSTAAAIKVSEQEFVQMHPSVLRQKMAVQEMEKTVPNKQSLGYKMKMGIIEQAVKKKM